MRYCNQRSIWTRIMKTAKIPFIKSDLELGVPLIITLSSISSVWINNVFFQYLLKSFDFYRDNNNNWWFYNSVCQSHFILSIATSYFLYIGIKKSDRVFLRFWLGLRIVELGLTIASTIFFIVLARDKNLAPVGFILIGFTVYLTLCVKKPYNEMPTYETKDQKVQMTMP